MYAYETPVITPIDGTWTDDSGISLNFDESFTANRYFNSDYELSARLNDADPVNCGSESTTRFEAKYISGRVEFYPEDTNNLDDAAESSLCLKGEFEDLAALTITTPDNQIFGTFRNDRVAVRMDFGGGRSADGNVELAFNDPATVDNDSSREATGCVRYSDGEIVSFLGTMFGLTSGTRYPPYTDNVLSSETGQVIYSSILYKDVFTLNVTTVDGQNIVFNRIENTDLNCTDQ